MSKTNVFNLAGLLDHEAALSDLIAPTIYRLASSQKQWKQGSRTVDIIFRKAKGAPEQSRQLQIEWDLASMGHGSLFREDLRKAGQCKAVR